MAGSRQVIFARINRRIHGDQPALHDQRPLKDDIEALANAHNTRAEEAGRSWVVADLKLEPDEDFATGVLVLLDSEWRRYIDEESWSILKGERFLAEGGSEKAMAPFAIDVRSGRRWLAFAKAPRISESRFTYGFGSAINVGVEELGLWPNPWEVDLITAVPAVRQWLRQHPQVSKFSRSVKRSNPGRDLDDDRQEMRELGAGNLRETFTPPRNQNLRVVDMNGRINEIIEQKLRGIDMGDVHVTIFARGAGGRRYIFSSRRRADQTWIQDFGDDFELGVELVLDTLREYSENRAAEETSEAESEGEVTPNDEPETG